MDAVIDAEKQGYTIAHLSVNAPIERASHDRFALCNIGVPLYWTDLYPYSRGPHDAFSLAPFSALFARRSQAKEQPPQRPDTSNRPASILPASL